MKYVRTNNYQYYDITSLYILVYRLTVSKMDYISIRYEAVMSYAINFGTKKNIS